MSEKKKPAKAPAKPISYEDVEKALGKDKLKSFAEGARKAYQTGDGGNDTNSQN